MRQSRLGFALLACLAAGGLSVLAARSLPIQDVETIFVFGDSYSSNGFTIASGMKHVLPGSNETRTTTTGGLNWIQYVAQQAGRNLSSSLYDFAISGSSVRSIRFHEDDQDPNAALVDEVDFWSKHFTGSRSPAQWKSDRTLFVLASGINDMANADSVDWDYPSQLQDIIAEYTLQIQRLYDAGARHFLFTSMPPFHRTPGAHGSKRQAKWVHAWNYALEDMITSLARDVQKFPEAEMRLFNWTGLFNEMLDSAPALGFENWTSSCRPYFDLKGYKPEANYKECHHPMKQYFWRDDAHPTWPVHERLGKAAFEFLSGQEAPTPVEVAVEAPSSFEEDGKRHVEDSGGQEMDGKTGHGSQRNERRFMRHVRRHH